LLAVAPGLISDLLALLAATAGSGEIASVFMFAMLVMPLVALVWLIILGGRYVKAGMSDSAVLFVLGFGLLNALLWGAGCSLMLSPLSGGMH
jgi:hypothetical protein